MEAIIYGIVAVSLVICLVLMFYYGRWVFCNRIKPAYVRRNVLTFGWVQAVVLITAMLINGIVMDVRGIVPEFNPNEALLIVLITVILSFFFALMCRETLLKNYLSGVNIGDKCQFVVATVFEQRLEGYVVVGNNNWLPAEATIAPDAFVNYKENQQLTAVICSAHPDNKFIVVEV